MSDWRASLKGLALEMLLWALPATLFLLAYVLRFHGPPESIAPHLALVLSGAASLALLRVVLARGEGALWRIARAALITLHALLYFALMLYYLTVLTGLASWGRVATLPLLGVYLKQWPDLLQAMQLPILTAPLALLLGLAATLWLSLFAHRRAGARSTRALLGNLVPVALAMLLLTLHVIEVRAAIEASNERSGEPVMLMLNPWLSTRRSQSNNSEGARALDQSEALAAASYQPVPRPLPHRRNVFLIVGDALRGSRLPMLGYERNTTPWLAGLHEQGRFAVAERATAVCAESYCGLMGIARSRYVHEFSRQSLTLHRVLRMHGYRVGLVLSGDHTNFYGLGEALGPADWYWDSLAADRYVNDDRGLLDHVGGMPPWDGVPVAIQFHLMSSHGLGLRQEQFRQFQPARNYYPKAAFNLDPEQTRLRAGNYYDNGLLQLDWVVQQLLQHLGEKGYLQDAVILITGDHGEMLGEQGRYAHAESVFQPALDVPFLMLRMGYAGQQVGSIRDMLSQIDIAPTLLDELGLPIPPTWRGRSVHDASPRPFVHFQQGREVGLIDQRWPQALWKYWKSVPDGTERLYDLRADPLELQDLSGQIPDQLRSDWVLQLLAPSSSVIEHPRDAFDTEGRVQ